MSEASGPPNVYKETPQKRAIKQLIGQKESQGNYNALVGPKKGKKAPSEAPITEMSLAEVLKYQDSMVGNGHLSTAVGKYQFVNTTLKEIIQRNPTDFPMDEPFNEARQELAANILLDRRKWEKFANGEISDKEMATNLSMEWASFPVPEDMKGKNRDVKAGESFYAGDGKNKSGVDPQTVLKTLNVIPGPSEATTLIDMPEAPLSSQQPVEGDPLAAVPQVPPEQQMPERAIQEPVGAPIMAPQPMDQQMLASLLQGKGMMNV